MRNKGRLQTLSTNHFKQTWSQGHNKQGQGQGLDLQGQGQGLGLQGQGEGQGLDLQLWLILPTCRHMDRLSHTTSSFRGGH